MKYKGTEIIRTNTTTDVRKMCFGKPYNTIGYVYELTGNVNKTAGQRPFLTSVKDCKNFINKDDVLCDDGDSQLVRRNGELVSRYYDPEDDCYIYDDDISGWNEDQ